ncbi:type VI secretion system baseplate subunit TssK [Polyangium sp. 15x6]|uniref:type VI secretion system baseplate subunit TssK n=1 Tax=Polyangium sp. 15x6 TaxID=3042687 RepID=UPI00249BEA9B|nr:type VI secretion system baseplate subunit TssK [Polyangium sp. 15x6]MDI3286924.1 type VI secretion system baseplate subunit TssK [Polyangium sp. 15x6]
MAALARPKWRIGQVLLPEHFLGLEDALSAEAALRASLLGLPLTGIARLEWNGDDPRNGVLWVSGLSAVLPDGALVDVPGNARLSAPLDLKAVGRRRVEVFAHVLPPDDEANAEGALEPPSPKEIPRVFLRVVLSSEASIEGSIGRAELGHFEVTTGGQFRLSTDFIPPLVRLGSTPYLAPRLTRLRGELAEIEGALDDLALEAVARGDSAAALFRVRVEARKLGGLLDDMDRGVHLHPYPVYSALRNFALELGLLDERAAPFAAPPYDHHDLARVFGVVLDEISSRARVPLPEEPAISFVPENGRLVAGDLPPEALGATELYVVVLKNRTADKLPLEGTVLSSPGRLRLVREHALRGMRLVYSPNPPFRHRFGGPVDFYRIVGAGSSAGEDAREWGAVLRERAICFLMPKELEGLQVLLSWRRS